VPARIETVSALDDAQVTAIRSLVVAVTATDGARPLSDHTMLRLRADDGALDRHLLALDGPDLLGYAHLDPGSPSAPGEAEIAVTPDARASGAAQELLSEVRRATPGPVHVWAHGEHSGVLDLARDAGLSPDRVLFQLRRPLAGPGAGPGAAPLGVPQWPEGVTVRTFVPGRDEAAWLEVNNRAFADHPDQSGWTLNDIREREAQDWFDPDGFFLAEYDGRLAGFHWTKVHPAAGSASDSLSQALGEVYVIGIDPSMQGRRLGPALTLHGLRHLRDAGIPTAMLYVDESNSTAVALYERLGFTRYDTDVRFLAPEIR
jgi:mycothiol synthase